MGKQDALASSFIYRWSPETCRVSATRPHKIKLNMKQSKEHRLIMKLKLCFYNILALRHLSFFFISTQRNKQPVMSHDVSRNFHSNRNIFVSLEELVYPNKVDGNQRCTTSSTDLVKIFTFPFSPKFIYSNRLDERNMTVLILFTYVDCARSYSRKRISRTAGVLT